jgi:hypothetical protein
MERDTPITPEDPDIPSEPPPPEDGEPEIHDQPLGPPADLDEDDAPLHWGAKTMAMIVGIAFAAACVIAVVDGNDVFGVAAANTWTKLVFGAAAAALLIVAMLPRVGRRKERVVEDDRTVTTGDRRFERDGRRVDEPVGTTERRV